MKCPNCRGTKIRTHAHDPRINGSSMPYCFCISGRCRFLDVNHVHHWCKTCADQDPPIYVSVKIEGVEK